MGPRLYLKYTEPLGILAKIALLLYHFYADDSQLWKSAKANSPKAIVSALQCLESGLGVISDWMSSNKLKLNHSKTEFLIIGSDKNRSAVEENHKQVGKEQVFAVASATNLGVTIDQAMSFKLQIANVVKSCRFYIHKIWKIRKFPSSDTAKSIVHATIVSRLDYCNALYINLPESHIEPLEKGLREAARLVTLTPRRERITPVMYALHWLPVKFRIKYKVLLLVYKTLNGLAPSYMNDMLKPYTPSRRLRSSDKLLLEEPRYRLKTAGLRSFQAAAPRLWNTLPHSLRSSKSVDIFKKDLKTYLFKIAYSSIIKT